MAILEATAGRATCDRGKSACIIVRENIQLMSGYVGAPAGTVHCDDVGHEFNQVIWSPGEEPSQHCIRTAHAEANAIALAAREGVSIKGATLYCRMTPCYLICAKMIITTGIIRVVAQKDYQRGERSKEVFEEAGVEFVLLDEEVQTYGHEEE